MTGSAGSRRPSSSQLEDRIAELEQRLLELEGRRPTMESTRTWFRQIVPDEAGRHFRTAMREQLLGVRVLVDHWIKRVDPETRSAPRETIHIE
jgi:hypothetical protein